MNPLWLMWVTSALMLVMAVGCTALCLVCARGAWRRDLFLGMALWGPPRERAWRLRGWPGVFGSGVVAVASAYYALLGWYGWYRVLTVIQP